MQKNISLFRSSALPAVDYAYASTVPPGMKLLFMAGACPLDSSGNVPLGAGYEAQATLCVANLKTALRELGASLRDVAYTRVLVASTSRKDLVTAWDTIRKEFSDHDVPSTLSGVTVLGYDNQLVEIEAVAAIADNL